MRRDGTFIAVEVQASAAADPALTQKLVDACPVDIFAQDQSGTLEIVEANLDECVLCRLCIDADPDPAHPAVKVIKLYDAGALLV
jgi:NAD-dependent dihydropyrimidine dehydrogenase PreA subunit